jgi:hypothetical protein
MSLLSRKPTPWLGVALALLVIGAGPFAAAQSSSDNYQVNEYFFGSGGELEAGSDNYRARQSAGELVVGNSGSPNYQFQGGFTTTDEPLLEVFVDGGTYDMGVLDAAVVHGTSATFSVRSYLSGGYTVALRGDPPAYEGHTLPPMTALATSSPGTEQFGVNLTANSSPALGADPVQYPDGTFSFGEVVAGYDTSDMFKFVDGDTIAFSLASTGQTAYTLSMIANIAPNTPAGQYAGRLDVIVAPTF